jgi:hypothetical protein
MGLSGAGISVAASVFLISAARTIEVGVLFKLLPWNRTFLKPIAAALFSLGATHLLQVSLLPGSYAGAFLGVCFFLLAYATCIIMLGLDEKDRWILKQLRSRAKR